MQSLSHAISRPPETHAAAHWRVPRRGRLDPRRNPRARLRGPVAQRQRLSPTTPSPVREFASECVKPFRHTTHYSGGPKHGRPSVTPPFRVPAGRGGTRGAGGRRLRGVGALRVHGAAGLRPLSLLGSAPAQMRPAPGPPRLAWRKGGRRSAHADPPAQRARPSRLRSPTGRGGARGAGGRRLRGGGGQGWMAPGHTVVRVVPVPGARADAPRAGATPPRLRTGGRGRGRACVRGRVSPHRPDLPTRRARSSRLRWSRRGGVEPASLGGAGCAG